MYRGELRFSTPEEYTRRPGASGALWRGDVVVSSAPGSSASTGAHYVPPIEAAYLACIAHAAAELRVAVEGHRSPAPSKMHH